MAGAFVVTDDQTGAPIQIHTERAARHAVSIDLQFRIGPAAGHRYAGVRDLLPLKALHSAIEAGDGTVERP
ncbi:MAG TPA: hypothetical protein VE505_17040, partial [Vicinamibacterales bacterium]|nr:hypothetical protein [Vicinamibacterales bacterium]